jgi:GTP cyclohydrolase I
MQIAKTIMEVLKPRGVAVTIDAAHQCMTNRGVKKENTRTVTNYFLGAFKDDLNFKNRYLGYINKD